MVVLPALSLASVMPGEEWDALGPDEHGRGEQTHPQYHLKLLLDRIGSPAGRQLGAGGDGDCTGFAGIQLTARL